jgi:hypothetical protein
MTVKFTNVAAFERDLAKFVALTGADADQVVRKVGIDIFAGVTRRTPVDTGHARSAWALNYGGQKSKGGVDEGGTGAAIAENKLEVAGFLASQKQDTIWITNNLPYIIPLENGHSKQADKGFMVQRTLSVVKSTVKDAIKAVT